MKKCASCLASRRSGFRRRLLRQHAGTDRTLRYSAHFISTEQTYSRLFSFLHCENCTSFQVNFNCARRRALTMPSHRSSALSTCLFGGSTRTLRQRMNCMSRSQFVMHKHYKAKNRHSACRVAAADNVTCERRQNRISQIGSCTNCARASCA